MKTFTSAFEGLVGTVRHLDPRIRPATRANEVASLRLRLLAEASPEQASPEEVALALELRAMRERMLALVGEAEACQTCAVGYPPPNGQWDGGYCCGGTTENVFTQEEIACLRASGTQPKDLKPPRGEHAGCSFRGPFGCSLPPSHRPNLCLRYACKTLWDEYERRGISRQVRALASEMQRKLGEFKALRTERLERESLAQFEKL